MFIIVGANERQAPQQIGLTTPEGCVLFTPMPSDPTLEVVVLLVKGWARRKSIDTTNEDKLMRMNI
jgi:uncharacterized protein YbbC (DUF1343 family)